MEQSESFCVNLFRTTFVNVQKCWLNSSRLHNELKGVHGHLKTELEEKA